MSYVLGSVTLPNPKDFTREIVETSVENLLSSGRTTKRIQNRKERFKLTFSYLTLTEVSSILSEYSLNTIRDFSVNETNLMISATPVIIDIEDRDYTGTGIHYRENLTLILTEIQ